MIDSQDRTAHVVGKLFEDVKTVWRGGVSACDVLAEYGDDLKLPGCVEMADILREELNRAGVLAERDYEGPKFHFDLNLGDLTVRGDLDSAWRLVQIARFLSLDGNHGEFRAIMGAVALKENLGDERVRFTVGLLQEELSKPSISLERLLEQHGYRVDSLAPDKEFEIPDELLVGYD